MEMKGDSWRGRREGERKEGAVENVPAETNQGRRNARRRDDGRMGGVS